MNAEERIAALERRIARLENRGPLMGAFTMKPAATNTVVDALRVERLCSGTAADGIGVGLPFMVEDASGNVDEAGNIDVVLTTAAHATQAAEMRFGVLGNTRLALKSGYQVYGFVPLLAPLTSTSWDGDAYSTAAKTLIDLSAVFSAPAGIKAALFRIVCRDSGSAASTSNLGVMLSPNDTASNGPVHCRVDGLPNDVLGEENAVVPCDANGDVYYQLTASGASTLDVWLQIWGYWI